jgi:hypothetical protein
MPIITGNVAYSHLIPQLSMMNAKKLTNSNGAAEVGGLHTKKYLNSKSMSHSKQLAHYSKILF